MAQVDLFITSDRRLSDPLIDAARAATSKRSNATLTVKPVLEHPIEVVELQVFHAPALVIDGRVIATKLTEADQLAEILTALL